MEAAPVRIYTVYRDNIRSGGEHRSRASAARRHFFNYDINLHDVRNRRRIGAILVLSNNDESLEETNMNKNL